MNYWKIISKKYMKEEKYNKVCSEDDCYRMVTEDDIERDSKGTIYERSKKCWDCRTPQDRKAIKVWRKKCSSKKKLSDDAKNGIVHLYENPAEMDLI